ncbi:hypothetical protein OZ401_002777 [Candidatus Chlorohelix allophototropha]|uniref:Uncharacterized protein n=1 Tax=Candidatus Chlorohelix allophototropha TaxID=3003348 RepID=A0ABY9B7T0_9CHLR|nr:hypothetical protein OZ401_002777 [Chloroflexota bacterium L227-S17]
MSKKKSAIILGLIALLALIAVPFSAIPASASTVAFGNCTYTQGYWKTHPESWPVNSLTIGGVSYSKDQLIKIFNTPPKGDASYILMDQLIAAKLNLASGASDSAVATTIANSDTWLSVNKLGSKSKDQAAINMGSILDQFNNGLIGPGHCGSTPPPPPVPTPTPSQCFDYNGSVVPCP